MQLEEIKEFLTQVIDETKLSDKDEIKIEFLYLESSARVIIKNPRYEAEGAIWTNNTFEVNAVDFEEDKVLFDYSAPFESVEDLEESFKRIVNVFES